VDALSWRWIFLVNVPIGVAALVVARLRLRESRDPAASGVDLRGVALLCPALFLLVYALIRGNEEGWGSALIVSCFAASVLLLVLFVVAERSRADPLLDLSLFRKPAARSGRVADGDRMADLPRRRSLLNPEGARQVLARRGAKARTDAHRRGRERRNRLAFGPKVGDRGGRRRRAWPSASRALTYPPRAGASAERCRLPGSFPDSSR